MLCLKVTIEAQTLSDKSKVHNVVLRQDGYSIHIPATSEEHAKKLVSDLDVTLDKHAVVTVHIDPSINE